MSENTKLPVVPLRGSVLFPGHAMPVVISHLETQRAVEASLGNKGEVFAVAVRNDKEKFTKDDLYKTGVTAQVGLVRQSPNGMSLLLQGHKRASAVRYETEGGHLVAVVSPLEEMQPLNPEDPAFKALFKEVKEQSKELGRLYEIPDDAVRRVVEANKEPGQFVDQVAGFLDLSVLEKQAILETLGVEQRMRKVLVHIQERIGILDAQKQIKSKVQEEISDRQREMYLREQLKAIKKELGEDEDGNPDLKDLRERLAALNLPKEARREVDRELGRLDRAGPGSSEAQVIRTFLELVAELPWDDRSEDQLDLAPASEVLDEDHYGLKDVKDRILEFLAVRRLRANKASADADAPDSKDEERRVKSKAMAKGPILLFVGPPGVGKTSIAKSIARALGRKYVRVSLGGTRDEADIRGHRRTYVGALPGRIIQGLKQAGTRNPVFLLDEIDKLGVSYQGDPASALMEVLDPAQNDSFVDHYLGVPFDLSEVLFIATANFSQSIPGPLLDRMDAVEFTGYTEREKVEIAKGYLVPRQLTEAGMDDATTAFSDGALFEIIRSYTRESGVRQLEREIGRLLRKQARKLATQPRTENDPVTVLDEDSVKDSLGHPKVRQEKVGKDNVVGVATGMYYTPMGGDIMFVEASAREISPRTVTDSGAFDRLGSVSLILTGQLGDVMKESARAALTYATTHAEQLQIPAKHLGSIEAHIHVPAGAVPKDGPSAGVTMATALTSALSGRPVRKEVAMTGEITLRGRVLPIGGVKEKVLGAYRAGVKVIILPVENKASLDDIPAEVLDKLQFNFVETLDDVLETALLPRSRAPYLSGGLILSSPGRSFPLNDPNPADQV